MKILYKVLVYCVLPLAALALLWMIYQSIMEPIRNDAERDSRVEIAIQRLSDIRTLNIEYYKMHENQYAPCIDSLKNFYNNGFIRTEFKFGEPNDSTFIAETQKYQEQYKKTHKPKNRKDKNEMPGEDLYALFQKGAKVYGTIPTLEPVKNVLFVDDTNKKRVEPFSIDNTFIIPFCGDTVTYAADVKNIAGVDVAVFQAEMTYNQLLQGMDRQYIINLNADCKRLTKDGREEQIRYPGVKVGDIEGREGTRGSWE